MSTVLSSHNACQLCVQVFSCVSNLSTDAEMTYNIHRIYIVAAVDTCTCKRPACCSNTAACHACVLRVAASFV